MSCSHHHSDPAFANAVVLVNTEVSAGVFHLVVKCADDIALPVPGQFFMMRSIPSARLLCRPISVFHVRAREHVVEFLILKKGQGTAELCSVAAEDSVELLGPQGNSFADFLPSDTTSKIALLGAGIGVAPVAGFAATLQANSYDFYASFRSAVYGLDNVQARQTRVTTEDGSVGTKGMLPAVFTADVIRSEQYGAVYACGPEPMLAYVKRVCDEVGVTCYLSMEARMACGMGACLGCTIPTTEGNRRCCVDGPVFPGAILQFPPRPQSRITVCESTNVEPNVAVTIAGVPFKNPVIAASGTFGYGSEYAPLFDISSLGGICSKGLTLEPRSGNTGVRLCETDGGLVNSIGLENPGIRHFIDCELPAMMKFDTTVIANLSGSSRETYVQGAALLDATPVPMIELNISCPNVKAGGMAFGLVPETAADIVSAVRKATSKPLMVKLSPNAPQLCDVAEAVVRAGADAISLVNTFQALAINIETGLPVFDNVTAGLAGPAIKPLALRMVWDVCRRIESLPPEFHVPVVGLGGIRTAQDAIEFIMAGAAAVQVGTATFADPLAMVHIVNGIADFMRRKKIATIAQMQGIVR